MTRAASARSSKGAEIVGRWYSRLAMRWGRPRGCRGNEQQLAMLTSLSTEDLIPKDHPIRRIRRIVDEVLVELDGEFGAMYSRIGRPSIPPEQLLKATVLMALYSVRSERAFCERLNYDLLFKWFLDLPIDAKAFDPTTFTKNRDRLLEAEIADRFFAEVVRQAQAAPLRLRASTSPWTGPCWRRGRHTRASSPRGWSDPGGAGGPQRRGGLARPEAVNHTHRLTTDPEAPALPQVSHNPAPRCATRAPAHGEPQRPDRRRRADPCRRLRRAGHRHRDARPAPRTARRRTVAADKGYDTAGSSPSAATSASPRTSPRTPPGNAQPSTGAPPATPVTGRAYGSGTGSRNPSGGSRPSPAAASSATSADNATGPGSRSPPPSTTSSASPPSVVFG